MTKTERRHQEEIWEELYAHNHPEYNHSEESTKKEENS